MMAVVLSCTRAPLVSAHCSLSPDDVFVCWVGSSVSADWLPSCAPAARVSVALEHSVTFTCTKVE